MHSVKIKKWKFKKKPYIFFDTFFLYHVQNKLSGTKKWNLKKNLIYKNVSICIFDTFWGLMFWCLCLNNLGNRLPNCQCHWHSTQTRLHDRGFDIGGSTSRHHPQWSLVSRTWCQFVDLCGLPGRTIFGWGLSGVSWLFIHTTQNQCCWRNVLCLWARLHEHHGWRVLATT